MNIVDRIIEMFNPIAALQRWEARDVLKEVRNMEAERDRGRWNPATGTAEQIDSARRDSYRYKGRDLEQFNDMVESIVVGFERNIVGTGFQLQSNIPLKNDETKQDETLNRKIEKEFRWWCRKRNCDITGQQSFTEILAMIIRRRFYDGEILIIKTYDRLARIPFKIQVLEADYLDSSRQKADNGNLIKSGVEVDKNNKPVAYWFYKVDANGFRTLESYRVEADRVIHLFKKNRPTQVRGISEIGRSMERMRDTNEYLDADRVRARASACIAMIIETENPQGHIKNAQKDDDGNYVKKMVPGMIKYLRKGEKMTFANPGSIVTDSKGFVQTNQRLTASGVGMSYELASRDYSHVTFSSARQGFLEDQRMFEMMQKWLIEHVCFEIYTEWLISAVLAGVITIKDFWDDKERYIEHSWITPGWAWIDPEVEVSAARSEVAAGMNTLAHICAKKGQDWQDVMRQLAVEQQFAESLGLTLHIDPKGGTNSEQNENTNTQRRSSRTGEQ